MRRLITLPLALAMLAGCERSPSRTRPRTPCRRLLALLSPALLLAGYQERELPTALAPEGPLFDHVGASYVVSNTAMPALQAKHPLQPA